VLHDLDEVAGRIFRRQQAEGGAGAGLDRIDAAGELTIRIGIDPHLDRLAGPHAVKLRLLVVGDHPDIVGHEHHQALTCGRKGADRAGQPDDAPGLGCSDARVLRLSLA
jgi:hypothetical protein